MKKINLIDKVYHQNVPVIYDTGKEEVNDYILRRYGVPDVIDNGCAGTMVELTSPQIQLFLVWLEKFKNDPYYIGILCHELNHLAMAVMRSAGIGMTRESEEAFTYLQQYYMQSFLTQHKNKRKR